MSKKITPGTTIKKELSEELQQSYLDYAMSVIISRALPDVRDGMKPVARRILFSMWQQGLRSTAKFRKSANVVGDVLGKYHPHGDSSVYDALARLTQDFSLRYPLITGQGNWGSIDGDSPAAMRYTEAKLSKLADEMLINIEKDTVNFADNYDGARREPVVLPSAIPNFLVNGTLGIAVGMATNVPPHNIGEVCSAAIELIDNPSATIEDLIKHVKGPDFPTGGAIYNQKDILQAYATGKGSIVMRAIAEIEEEKSGSYRIIVREIPYLVNKSVLVTKIAEAVKTKRLEGIRDLRDESDKDGIRIVIELKKDAYPRKTLNRLYAITDLQKSFHVNMIALIDKGKQPKVLTLKDALEEHIKHRQEVITRRTKYDLKQAKDRAHILEGLKKALDQIDKIIATIKKSRTKETAHINLSKDFALTSAQTTAILEMRLQTLAGLERKKVEDELREKKAIIHELEGILKDPKKILEIIKEKYKELIEKYGDPRRTRVIKRSVNTFSQEDLIPDDPTIVTITRDGYIKRLATSTYRVQHRGGKGVKGMSTKEEDIVDTFLATTTHKDLLFFTNQGRVFTAHAYEIPATTRGAKGKALQNLLELAPDEHVTALQALPDKDESTKYLLMATQRGVIKKTSTEDFVNIRKSGLRAITLKGKDTLDWVSTSTGNDEVLLVTAMGQAIRFAEKNVRPMGRTAAGVRGMKLKVKDNIVAMHVITDVQKDKAEVLVISELGYGKRTPLPSYRLQQRGGTGIKTANITTKTGELVRASIIDKDNLKNTDTLIISENGQVIRIPASSISKQGRATQGVKVMSPTTQSGNIATFTTWTEPT